jgi:hypothetical protein
MLDRTSYKKEVGVLDHQQCVGLLRERVKLYDFELFV